MKQSKILLITAAVLALLVMAGCASNEPAPNPNPEATINPTQDSAQAPETPHALSATVVDINQEDAVIDPSAMDMEAAALVGIQYIYDVFGTNAGNMYIELEFANWEHVTRTLWIGAVADNYRNTQEQRARINELNDQFMARLEAGEDNEEIFEEMNDLFAAVRYTPALFYFIIDAITGERIDIWRTRQARIQAGNESIPLHEYIEQEWDGDWDAAFAPANIDPQTEDELGQMAKAYAQRHFGPQAIEGISYEGAFTSFIYSGGGYDREIYAAFTVTNDAGREARVSIHVESRTVISVNTMSNDFVHVEGYWGMREERVEPEELEELEEQEE